MLLGVLDELMSFVASAVVPFTEGEIILFFDPIWFFWIVIVNLCWLVSLSSVTSFTVVSAASGEGFFEQSENLSSSSKGFFGLPRDFLEVSDLG